MDIGSVSSNSSENAAGASPPNVIANFIRTIMTKTRLSPIKTLARTIEFVFWQLLLFFLSVYILSFIDDIFSAFFNYDSVKSSKSIDVKKYCLFFLVIVAIPRTVFAIVNRPWLFKITGFTSVLLMGLYIFYDYYNSFGLVYRQREFFVLLFSLIISYGITIPLLKELPRHVLKRAH